MWIDSTFAVSLCFEKGRDAHASRRVVGEGDYAPSCSDVCAGLTCQLLPHICVALGWHYAHPFARCSLRDRDVPPVCRRGRWPTWPPLICRSYLLIIRAQPTGAVPLTVRVIIKIINGTYPFRMGLCFPRKRKNISEHTRRLAGLVRGDESTGYKIALMISSPSTE